MKKLLSIFLVAVLCIGIIPNTASAAVKISKVKATMEVGSTLKLKANGTSKNATWKTSKKSVATVSKSGTITAKSEGKATITATAGSEKYTCAVTVVDQNGNVAGTYPASTTKYPQETPIGAKCVGAQQAYGLVDESDKITVYVEMYDNNHKKHKATFVLDIE
jgi:uncharacterized protein YjdB